MLLSALVGCSSDKDGGTGGGGPGQGGGDSAPVECFEARAGCVVPSSTTRIEDPDVSEEELASLSLNNASFGLDLGRALHSSTKNVVYSPFSISTGLAMAYAGARTTTEQAIAKAMRFELPQERLHPAFNRADLDLKKRAEGSSASLGGGFRLHTVNAIWSHVGFELEQPFLTVLGENYGVGALRLADFNAPKEAEVLINAWVKDRTEGKIPELLQDNVNEFTRVVLTNAIYFDAAWQTSFNEEATEPGAFRRGDGTSVTARMMRGQQNSRHGAGDGWEAVEIPYAGAPVSMFLVLPAEGTADAFEESLDGAALEAIIASMQARSVDVTMPKFSFGTHTSLLRALGALGMGIAFSEDGADFSGITPLGGAHIQDVIHQAVIDVDEAGTEASAATAVIIAGTGGGAYFPPAAIVLDRPFFFFISDLQTKALLFAGRVNDPTAR
ncbi:serpin family protein [Sorangium sp. So ce1151]|uniref:serpin family protein n=1 Tax=Sorangium sp. So ce1151 TaxID=3133332 RepID=UPI003F5FD1F3